MNLNLNNLRLRLESRFSDGAMRCEKRWLVLLALTVLLGSLQLLGQVTNTGPQMNDAVEAADLSQTNDVAEPDNGSQTEDQSSTNGLAQTNSQNQASNRDGRSRRSRRQRQNGFTGSAAGIVAGSGNSATASANSTNGAASLDYAAFKIVADGNIFNPNRQGYRLGGPRAKPKAIETFALVGIMSYEKGTFAFFDGSGSEYRKALQTNDSIAGYQLTAIDPNSVKLAIQTNELELRVGMQMRREDEGPWFQPRQSEIVSASLSSATNSAPDTAASGAASEILKKLMQRREQE